MSTKTQKVICLECPFACRISVETDNNRDIILIKDNKCPKGESYARNEVIAPKRVLTTTVYIDSRDKEHPLLPVQTKGPIGLELLEEAMKKLAEVKLKPPVKYGEIIGRNILNTGVDVIATDERLE